MEQKDYKFEIVLTLLQEKNHIRAIANKLGTNHMIIVRKMRELLDSNVVDFLQEGKNKTYFLKKTVEAKCHVHMAEYYKKLQTIEKYPSLRAIIEKLENDQRVQLAVIFGSYAKYTADKGSDIDIFIETQDKALRDELARTDSRLSLKIGTYQKESALIREIEKSHVVLKGVEKFYEKNRFFD
ncbi:MAG: nucleotidyltransferase domain-containing protein [Candidatus Bathyarchaeota archaeon]|nr:nucleotidyltransferase domain-containing protein [Candidatus Bathyarchaeota archaeon]